MGYILGIVIMLFLLNLLSALSLIFIERKEPTTTWAWLLILIALPGIGFILYLLLGQNLSRQKIFREKKLADKIKRYKLRSEPELPNFNNEVKRSPPRSLLIIVINGLLNMIENTVPWNESVTT